MIIRSDVENAGEKCPQCRFIGRSFLEVSDVFWACMDCGCVFMPKRRRLVIRGEIAEEKKVIKEDIPIEAKGEEIIDKLVLKCGHPGCDFETKYPGPLASHKRKHARD